VFGSVPRGFSLLAVRRRPDPASGRALSDDGSQRVTASRWHRCSAQARVSVEQPSETASLSCGESDLFANPFVLSVSPLVNLVEVVAVKAVCMEGRAALRQVYDRSVYLPSGLATPPRLTFSVTQLYSRVEVAPLFYISVLEYEQCPESVHTEDVF
jgi:hypothetical protein